MHPLYLVEPDIETTLSDLGSDYLDLDYFDLYLFHWPFCWMEDGHFFPNHADYRTAYSKVDYIHI